MLLLWQHVHTLPIGKVLSIAEHTKDSLKLVSAIVDMNELSHDAAVMIDNQMGRFSHGFRALEYEEIKENDDDEYPSGFDVKKFEIMEASLVSVPSNVDAETEEVLLSLVEGGKLTSGVMKEVGKTIRSKQNTVTVPVKLELDDESKQVLKEIQDANKSRGGDSKAEDGGESGGTSKEADAKDGTKDAKEEAGPSEVKRYIGRTGEAAGHDHPVVLDDEGNGVAQQAEGHTHKVMEFKVETEDGHSHSLDKGELEERSFEDQVKKNLELMVKSAKEEKGGRALSKANESRIKDAKETIDEVIGMEIPKAAKAGLREASGNLKEVLGSLGDEEASAEAITVEKAAGVVLYCATKKQKQNIKAALELEEDQQRSKQRIKQFRALVGSKR
jgi:hypothetical protein